MACYQGFDVWSRLVMKDGKWVHLPKRGENTTTPPEEDNSPGPSKRCKISSNSDEVAKETDTEKPTCSTAAKRKLPKRFVSGVKKIDWTPELQAMDRRLENERRAKEKAAAKRERQIPKYKEIEHVSVEITRDAEIARLELILADRRRAKDDLVQLQADLEKRLKSLQMCNPTENTEEGPTKIISN